MTAHLSNDERSSYLAFDDRNARFSAHSRSSSDGRFMTGVYHTKTLIYHAASSFPVQRGVIHFDSCNISHQFANWRKRARWQRAPLQHPCAIRLLETE